MTNSNPVSLPQAPGNGPLADTSATMLATSGVTSVSGHLYFSDADAGDRHTVSVNAGSNAGLFEAFVSSDINGNGVIDWSYKLNAAGTPYAPLSLLGQHTQTYVVTITDTAGGSTTENVSITTTVSAVRDSLSAILALTPNQLDAANQLATRFDIEMSATEAAGLSAADLARLQTLHTPSAALTGANPTLSVAKAQAFIAAGMNLYAESGALLATGTAATLTALTDTDRTSLATHGIAGYLLQDRGAVLARLAPDALQSLLTQGVNAVDLLNNRATVSVATYNALAATGLDGGDRWTVNGTAGADMVSAHGGTVMLNGLAGKDSLTGGSVIAYLSGGKGRDSLTGGAGTDHFVFNEAAKAANSDTILNFDVDHDVIDLSGTVFKALTGGHGGALVAQQFETGAAATSAKTRILFDDASGQLFYDADGSGSKGKVLIASFGEDHPALTAADLFVI